MIMKTHPLAMLFLIGLDACASAGTLACNFQDPLPSYVSVQVQQDTSSTPPTDVWSATQSAAGLTIKRLLNNNANGKAWWVYFDLTKMTTAATAGLSGDFEATLTFAGMDGWKPAFWNRHEFGMNCHWAGDLGYEMHVRVNSDYSWDGAGWYRYVDGGLWSGTGVTQNVGLGASLGGVMTIRRTGTHYVTAFNDSVLAEGDPGSGLKVPASLYIYAGLGPMADLPTVTLTSFSITGPEILTSSLAPLIGVENGGTVLTSGGASIDLGQSVVDVAAPAPVTFTVKNTGTGPLNLTGVTVEGANAGDFVVTPPAVSSVPAQQSTTFTVTFTPAAAGTRLATLKIASDDTPNSPFSIGLTGNGLEPAMTPTVTLTSPANGTTFPNGAAIPLAASVVTNDASIGGVTFYDGTTPIGAGQIGLNATWTFPDYGTLAIAPGTHVLTAQASYGIGQHVTSAAVTITVLGVPVIAVAQPEGTTLTSGACTIDFGSRVLGGAVPLTFTVKNTGTGPLTLTNVTVEGTNSGDYVVIPPAVSSVPAQESTTFTVTFTPAAAGTRLATLKIASDDTPNSPFSIGLTGLGSNPPVVPITTQPLALSVNSGQVALFQVAATNALTYQWRKNGVDLVLSDRVSGVNGPLLSISPALAGDAGVYTVLVSNAETSTLSEPAPLAIDLTLPAFSLVPQSQTCGAGEAVGFSAPTTGSEPITYQWLRYGTPLADDGRISGTTTSHLNITALTSTDSGWYWLSATNAEGSVASEPARLTVMTPGELGAAANFPEGVWTCGGAGGPWFAQGDFVQDGGTALRSSLSLPYSSSTYIETTVYGPGELSFYWEVSSEAGYDPFACQLDGVEQAVISGEQMSWTQRKVAVGWGAHVVRWVFSVDHNKPGFYNAGFLDQVAFTPTPLVSLETAAAPIPLPLRTTGDAAWFGQTTVNHDGSSAARSGYVTHLQSTTMETTVCGPGTIAFNWKVSSEYADPCAFLVDGVVWDQIAGDVDWTKRTLRIPWGLHTLSWRYSKDYSISLRSDAAWVDEVTFTPVTLSSLATAAGGLAPWTAGGSLPFFGQNAITSDGSAALQSGPITHNQSSSANSSVTGPGTLTFRWKVSSEDDDSLRFAIDGSEQARIAAEVDWNTMTYVIRPGTHAFNWSYVKDYTNSYGYDAGWVDTVAFAAAPTLAVALNAPAWTWTTSGSGAWFPEMVTTHDGTASARSGDIGDNQSVTMQTTVTGPGTLAFWWKVSSEYADPLIFLVDGVEQTRISGERDWAHIAIDLTIGSHTLSWRYQKDYGVAVGADAGWVDQVTFGGAITYPAWSAAGFTPEELADASISGPAANPMHDGISNLLKYASNMDPHIAYSGAARGLTPEGGLRGLPSVTRTAGGQLQVEYLQRVGATDCAYSVEFGSSLGNELPDGWVASTHPPTVTPTADPAWNRAVVVDTAPVDATRRFARLVVSGAAD